jgi:hypothetical protein
MVSTADQVETGDGLDERANGDAYDPSLLRVGLPRRALSDVERYAVRRTSDLAPEAISLLGR